MPKKVERSFSDIRLEHLEMVLGMPETVDRDAKALALTGSMQTSEEVLLASDPAVPFAMSFTTDRHTFTNGPHIFFYLTFERLETLGGEERAQAEGLKDAGQVIETRLEEVSSIVGGEEEFSVVWVRCSAIVSPEVRAKTPALGRGKGALKPVGIRYRSSVHGLDQLQELEWSRPFDGERTNFQLRYGMVDRWQVMKPWESEVARVRSHLQKSLS